MNLFFVIMSSMAIGWTACAMAHAENPDWDSALFALGINAVCLVINAALLVGEKAQE